MNTKAGLNKDFLYNILQTKGLCLLVLQERLFITALCFPNLLMSLWTYQRLMMGGSVSRLGFFVCSFSKVRFFLEAEEFLFKNCLLHRSLFCIVACGALELLILLVSFVINKQK